MKKYIFFFPFFLYSAFSKPQIYVGFLTQRNFTFNTINQGKAEYWNNTIKDAYKDSLEQIYIGQQKVQIESPNWAAKWFYLGLPKDYFNLLLQNLTSKVYCENNSYFQYTFTIGAYIFRKDDLLIATEVFLGKSSLDISKNITVKLFKGDIPNEIETGAGGTESNFFANNLIQKIYFSGDLDLLSNVSFNKNISLGINFRFGKILKDRVYIFTVLGLEGNKLKIIFEDKDLINKEVKMFYNINTSYGENPKWESVIVQPAYDLKTKMLSFSKEKFSLGVSAGLGAEFFVSRKISLRAQCSYIYYPDITFRSPDRAADVKYFAKDIQLSAGIFWRF
ncbi:MAG: hypothetical protein LBS83_03115 [Holosporales bacterium]|jgi:opacity protein-like surface antigen|nr:hypothetical protein [Holosporales bacterium]